TFFDHVVCWCSWLSCFRTSKEEEILDWKRQERSSSSTLSLNIRQQEGRL
ncbi:BnaAnng24870D, partial [Brassica napus]